MLPSYSSVESHPRITNPTSKGKVNRTFYLWMTASLALLSLVGFLAYSGQKSPRMAERAFVPIGEYVPGASSAAGGDDNQVWQGFTVKSDQRGGGPDTGKHVPLVEEYASPDTAPVDEEAFRRFEMENHEWEEEEEEREETAPLSVLIEEDRTVKTCPPYCDDNVEQYAAPEQNNGALNELFSGSDRDKQAFEGFPMTGRGWDGGDEELETQVGMKEDQGDSGLGVGGLAADSNSRR